MKQQIAIVSHNDLDGYGANVLAHFQKAQTRVVNTSYGAINKVLVENIQYKETREIHIVDLCLDLENYKLLRKISDENDIKIRIFEHHPQTKDAYNNDKDIINSNKISLYHNTSKCGSRIYHDWLLFMDKLKKLNGTQFLLLEELFLNINILDLHLEPTALGRALGSYHDKSLIEPIKDIIKNIEDEKPLLTKKLMKKLKEEMQKEDKRFEESLDYPILKKDGIHIELPYVDNIDYLADRILRERGLDYIKFNDKSRKKVSLRGNKAKNFQVKAIAESYGGGGHPFASGYVYR